MSSSINYTLVLLGASLATRFIVPDAHLVTYVGNFVVAFCFYTLCSLVYYRYLYTFYLSPLRDLPLIKRKTWGECLNLITAPTYLEGMNNLDNNGLLRRIDTLNQEVIIITTPEVAAEFFQKKADDYMKWVAMSRILDDMLGHGLLTAEGQDHRNQRKAVAPGFTSGTIKNLCPFFWSKSSDLVAIMQDEVSNHHGQDTPAILDMSDIASRISLDMISEAGFGSSFESLHEPDNALNKWYRAAFMATPKTRPIFILSLLTHPSFVNKLTFFELVRSKLEGMGGVRTWLRSRIEEKKEEMKQGYNHQELDEKSKDRDLVSAMMKSGTLNTDGLVEQSLTFLGAGHETSATSFTWAIHELAQPEHQHYQKALREEIRANLPSPESGTPITAEMLDSLPLLDAIVKENLRIHAPAPTTGRIARVDTILAGRHIAKGTPVRISLWAFGRCKKLWGEDAEVFRPERWDELKASLKDADADTQRESSLLQNIIFGYGPRGCIGKHFAIATLKATVAATIGRFDFKQVGNKHVDPETLFAVVGKITDLHVETRLVDGW